MMYNAGMKYSVQRRWRILRWHDQNGRNIAATCRRFGIGRSTFYRWLRMYDPENPKSSLKPRSRRPHTLKDRSWSEEDLPELADLSIAYPSWGRARLTRAWGEQGREFSESTVGRMLQRLRRGCPFCGKRNGAHFDGLHARDRDLSAFGLSFPRRRPTAKRVMQELSPGEAVRLAEEIIRLAPR